MKLGSICVGRIRMGDSVKHRHGAMAESLGQAQNLYRELQKVFFQPKPCYSLFIEQ